MLMAAALSWAQPKPESDPGEFDAFRPVETKWQVAAVLDFPFYSFYLGGPAINGVAYLPNFSPRLGPRVIYKDTGATLTFSLPLPHAERERRGDSSQTALLVNSYWRQNAFDLYYQRFRGFYVSSPWTELRSDKPRRYPQLPETQVRNYGVNWYYASRPGRYSFKAAFDQNEFQLKSGGSWIFNPFYNHLEMYFGDAFLPGTDPKSLQTMPEVASGRFDTVGCGVGYGYTYVRGDLFAAAQGVWGPGVQFQRIQRMFGEDEEFTVAAKLNVNMSAGWNHAQSVTGMRLLVDSIWAKVQDTQISSSLVNVQLFYGRRI